MQAIYDEFVSYSIVSIKTDHSPFMKSQTTNGMFLLSRIRFYRLNYLNICKFYFIETQGQIIPIVIFL